jgi:hypothetical protein
MTWLSSYLLVDDIIHVGAYEVVLVVASRKHVGWDGCLDRCWLMTKYI